MKIKNINVIENFETNDKKLLLDVIKRILIIGEKDKNISLQLSYDKLDDKLKVLRKKDDKYNKLLETSSQIRKDLIEKIQKLDSLNESIRENLLEMVGGEL